MLIITVMSRCNEYGVVSAIAKYHSNAMRSVKILDARDGLNVRYEERDAIKWGDVDRWRAAIRPKVIHETDIEKEVNKSRSDVVIINVSPFDGENTDAIERAVKVSDDVIVFEYHDMYDDSLARTTKFLSGARQYWYGDDTYLCSSDIFYDLEENGCPR